MTGDIARFDPEVGSYQILGRASVDIIKSAGYKISALEVERSILEHPDVAEVTVVGVEDEKWGQRLCAVVRRRDAGPPEPAEVEAAAQAGAWLREWLAERVAPYRVPSAVVEVAAIPKNAMGKVNKKTRDRDRTDRRTAGQQDSRTAQDRPQDSRQGSRHRHWRHG